MHNSELALDYVKRAEVRLRALDVLYDGESWADVVREAQEIVELALKGLLRSAGIQPPRIHDVSDILLAEHDRFPALQDPLPRLAEISRQMRRDRELAFYGAEALTPSGFYGRPDADRARDGARHVVQVVTPIVIR